MAGNATDTINTLASITLEDSSTVVVQLQYDGVNEDPIVMAVHITDNHRQPVDAVVYTSFLIDGLMHDLGWCNWCEEAESPTYLDHEGHDPECPFA